MPSWCSSDAGVLPALRELGAHRHAGMEGKAAAERIFEILDTRCSRTELCKESVRRARGLVLRHPVYLSGADLPALDGLTLTLPAGSRTAVVGRSGSERAPWSVCS